MFAKLRTQRSFVALAAVAVVVSTLAIWSASAKRSAASTEVTESRTATTSTKSGRTAQELWKQLNEAEDAGRFEEALSAAEELRGSYGDYYLVNLRAGWLYFKVGNYSTAKECYRRAANIAPQAVSPLHGLVNCYTATGESDQAIRCCRSVLSIDPMNATATVRLADLHFGRGEFAQAEIYFIKACTYQPEDLYSATRLGWCHLRQHRRETARQQFEAVLIAQPGHREALSGLTACDTVTSRN